MMTIGAIIELANHLAMLGASPAVQQGAIEWLGRMHGHSQADIDKAVAEQRHAWEPKQADPPKR